MKLKKITTIALVGGFPLVALATALLDIDGFNTDASNTVPDGSKSMALGTGNTANDYSLAIGINNEAKTYWNTPGRSLAVGNGNLSVNDSLSVGLENDAIAYSSSFGLRNYTNYYAVTAGGYNDARRYSFAAGYANHVIEQSIALGKGNYMTTGDAHASGAYNAADYGRRNILIGTDNRANLHTSNDGSGIEHNVLIGTGNISDEDDAIAVGTGNTGLPNAVVIGNYSDPADPNLTDAAVVLSCGTDNTNNKKNGLIIKNNGGVIMNGDVVMDKVQGDVPMGIYGQ